MNIVFQANNEIIEKMQNFYKEELDLKSTIPHTKFVVSNEEYKIIAYSTNKVMFQGKKANDEALLWQELLGIKPNDIIVENNQYSGFISLNDSEYIGSDEVGTGDYFGPVVVCACYINKDITTKIAHLNIRDSKDLNDSQIRSLAKALKDIVPNYVYVLNNERYNKANTTNNLNAIKAKMHNYSLLQLVKMLNKQPRIIVDQFCEEKKYYNYLKDVDNVVKDIIFETKAESKYLAVAIASILARDAFLEEFDNLSKEVEMKLMKGASSLVDNQAILLVNKYGFDILTKIAKLHFANTKKIKELLEQ